MRAGPFPDLPACGNSENGRTDRRPVQRVARASAGIMIAASISATLRASDGRTLTLEGPGPRYGVRRTHPSEYAESQQYPPLSVRLFLVYFSNFMASALQEMMDRERPGIWFSEMYCQRCRDAV